MNEEQSELAFKIHTEIKDNENQRRVLLAKNAMLLDSMLNTRMYKLILGDEEGTWAGYLSDIEVFYTRNAVDTMTRVYKKLTGKLDISQEIWVEVPITRLADALPFIDETNWEDWFTKALTQTQRDFKIELRKAKGQITEEDEHEHVNKIYEICEKCGKKHRMTLDEKHELVPMHKHLFTRKQK